MKRAMRLDKTTIAALEAVLRLYGNPDTLAETMPAIGLLSRAAGDITALANRVLPAVSAQLDNIATVTVEPCRSQIGSGSLPVDRLDSAALAIRPTQLGKGSAKALAVIVDGFRNLPVPVIGRVQDGAFFLDLRCLTDEAGFTAQLDRLSPA